MTSEQGGAIANRQGNILEQQVRQAFASHGFREVAFAEYEKLASGSTLPGVPVPDLLVRRVPYQSIYGHRGVTEFLAVSASRGLAIRIECKWQQSQGSVDEKFPYLYLNCIQAMPERVKTRRAGMAQAGCCFAGRQADSCVQPRGVPRLGEPEVEAKIKCAVSLLPASQPVDCKAGKGVGEERLFRKGSRLRFFQAKESVRAGP